MKSIFQLIATFFDWTNFCANHNRNSEMDWKEIGLMRSRLVRMRFERVPMAEIETAGTIGSMRASFRNLSNKERDRTSLKYWCKTKEEKKELNEKSLRERLYHSERAHRDRMESGDYPAISRDELDQVAETTYQVSMDLDAEAKKRLEKFLSGTSDDMNDMLFAPMQAAPVEAVSDVGASVDYTEFTEVIDFQPEVETTPTSALDVVAKLEDAIKLDAVGTNGGLSPVSLPAAHFISEEVESVKSNEPVSLSARLVHAAKVTPLRGRTRKV